MNGSSCTLYFHYYGVSVLQRYVAPECIDEKWQYQVIQKFQKIFAFYSWIKYVHTCV